MGGQATVRLRRGALEDARSELGIYQQTIAYYMQDRRPERYPVIAPFKLVNRAFNQRRVELRSAELIAEILCVPLARLLDLGDEKTCGVAGQFRLLGEDLEGQGQARGEDAPWFQRSA